MKTALIPKLSTPGKIDIARAALANDLPALSKLVAAIPGNPAKAGDLIREEFEELLETLES